MTRKRNFISLILAVFVVACQPPAESVEPELLDADEGAIRYLIEQYDNAINSGNSNAFLSIYSRTAVVLPPGRPVLFGSDAILARITEFLTENVAELKTEIHEIMVDREHVMVWYNYTESWTPKEGGETRSVRGKGVQIFMQQPNGAWRIAREIWNTDDPGGGT